MKNKVQEANKGKSESDTAPKKPEMIQFSAFFRYLRCRDKFLLIVGTVCAVLCGCLLPSMAIMMGLVTNAFNPTNSPDDILSLMQFIAWVISVIGFATWITGYFYFAFWQHLAENISFDLRSRYLHAILKQEIAYFEKVNVE